MLHSIKRAGIISPAETLGEQKEQVLVLLFQSATANSGIRKEDLEPVRLQDFLPFGRLLGPGASEQATR